MKIKILLHRDGNLSDEIQALGLTTLTELIDEAKELGATQYAAVATEGLKLNCNIKHPFFLLLCLTSSSLIVCTLSQ